MIRVVAVDPARDRIHDAILAVALNMVVGQRVKAGQEMTELEALHLLSRAKYVDIHPPQSLQLLGFQVKDGRVEPLSSSAACDVLRRVLASGGAGRVSALLGLFGAKVVDGA